LSENIKLVGSCHELVNGVFYLSRHLIEEGV